MTAVIACPVCEGTGVTDTDSLRAKLDKPGVTGNAHPETSRRAGTTPRKGSQRLQVLEALIEHGPMTAFDIANILHRSPNQIATRLGELHEDQFVGFVFDEDGMVETRATTPGNTGRVHQVEPLGQIVVNGHTQPEMFAGYA